VQKYLALVTRRGHSCSSRKSIAQVLGLPAAPQVSVLVKQVKQAKQVNTLVADIARVLGLPAAPQVSVLVKRK
jgi:alkylated DNA nucleotide flippase Atl1